MKTQPKRGVKSWQRHPLRIVMGGLLCVALLAGVALWGQNAYLDHADQARFATVKTDVSQLHDRLKSQFGGNWDLSPVCGRAHEAFGDGAAYCTVSTNSVLDITNGKQADNLIKEFEAVINTEDNFTVGGNRIDSPSNFPLGVLAGYGGRDYTDRKTGMICGTLYEVSEQNINKLSLRFSCNAQARGTYFPRFDIRN